MFGCTPLSGYRAQYFLTCFQYSCYPGSHDILYDAGTVFGFLSSISKRFIIDILNWWQLFFFKVSLIEFFFKVSLKCTVTTCMYSHYMYHFDWSCIGHKLWTPNFSYSWVRSRRGVHWCHKVIINKLIY